MVDTRNEAHPNCIACSLSNTQGMQLGFVPSDDGGVSAQFKCGDHYEGFPGILHGGVLSMILDGAMTNCLFAKGWVAVTADLRVQFRHPVLTDQTATVRAWITCATPPLYTLKADIIQNNQLKTNATGRFMEQPRLLNQASSSTFTGPAEPIK